MVFLPGKDCHHRSNAVIHAICRRKVVKRASSVLEPVQLNNDFVETLQRLTVEGAQSHRLLVATFLPTFLTDSSLLASHEVENFILSNGHMLIRWYVESIFGSCPGV